MSSDSGTERSRMATAGAGGGMATGAAVGSRALHARSFKLRFAAQREPGRSYVSSVKPLALPATVTDKFYSQHSETRAHDERAARALQRIRDMFSHGPRDKYPAPVTQAHEYGWWWQRGVCAGGARGHHIRDSAWLAARLRVLAADDKLKHK